MADVKPLTEGEKNQLRQIIQLQREVSFETGEAQWVRIIIRNGHMAFVNATTRGKALAELDAIIMDMKELSLSTGSEQEVSIRIEDGNVFITPSNNRKAAPPSPNTVMDADYFWREV